MVEEIKYFIDTIKELPEISEDMMAAAEDAFKEGIKNYQEAPKTWRSTMIYWYGSLYGSIVDSNAPIFELGILSGNMMQHQYCDVASRLKEHDYTVAEVAELILHGFESCIGAGMLHAIGIIVDGVSYKSIADAWTSNPKAKVEDLNGITVSRFMSGFVMHASMLF